MGGNSTFRLTLGFAAHESANERANLQSMPISGGDLRMKAKMIGLLMTFVTSCAWAQTPADLNATETIDYTTKDRPVETTMRRASSQNIDLRKLPQTRPTKFERPEHEEPDLNPIELPGAPTSGAPVGTPPPAAPAPGLP